MDTSRTTILLALCCTSAAPPVAADGARGAGNAVVVAWNQKAYEIAFAEDQLLTFKGLRAFTMANLAVHDALNAIEPVYGQYAPLDADPMADPVAAAAQAAHDVLLSQYPAERSALDALLADWLAKVPDGPGESHGIALGQQSASTILALREGDGWDFPGEYEFQDELGQYYTTPPWDGFVVQPGFRYARPFGLQTPAQFRPAPPPALGSRPYAHAYNEVKDFGSADSRLRTADQSRYAIWWMEFAEGSVNRLGRDLVAARQTDLWTAARLFALMDMSLYDGYVAVWDSKYEHNHWRPYTAIRQAGRDANPATGPSALWQPLRTTPPHPEYVSAHAAGCEASFDVLEAIFGEEFAFTMTTITAPPDMPTRSFGSFAEASAECADSRVRLGWHFRYSTDRGRDLGHTVADYIGAHYLEPKRNGRP